MKTSKLITLFIGLFCMTGNCLFAQDTPQEENAPAQPEVSLSNFYLGMGFGFDYGGIGAKAEYLPTKHFSLFGGLGYNLASLGFNVGGAFKILPDKKICPNILACYGYNGVFKGADSYAARYNMTSYGFTFGMDCDFLVGKKGDKISLGLWIPIRSAKFMDNYRAAENDPNLDIENSLIPIGLSFGYNFAL